MRRIEDEGWATSPAWNALHGGTVSGRRIEGARASRSRGGDGRRSERGHKGRQRLAKGPGARCVNTAPGEQFSESIPRGETWASKPASPG